VCICLVNDHLTLKPALSTNSWTGELGIQEEHTNIAAVLMKSLSSCLSLGGKLGIYYLVLELILFEL
jgi:hypothetical protein